jgi:CBS-domain-containing membrane protein
MPARVQDVMTIEVVVAEPTTPVKRVARLLADHRLSALPVVDGRGRVLGVVTLTGQIERRSLIPTVVAWPARPRGSCRSGTG